MPRRTDREQPVQVAADQVRAEQFLTGAHPVAVALDGVDLAVVGDHPERVRQFPAREGIGGEPGVHQRQRGGQPLVVQFGEDLLQLVGGQHALVDQGARGERGEVDPDLVFAAAAQGVRQPVQFDALLAVGAGHHELGEVRHHRDRDRAQGAVLGRDVAPAQHLEALGGGDLLDLGDRGGALVRLLGQEGRADGVRPGLGQLEVADLAQEGVGDLDQDAGAVTGLGVGTGGAAVVEVAQRLQALFHDVVVGDPAQLGDEGHPAGIVLEGRIVEPLGGAVDGPACDHGFARHVSSPDFWCVPPRVLLRSGTGHRTRGSPGAAVKRYSARQASPKLCAMVRQP